MLGILERTFPTWLQKYKIVVIKYVAHVQKVHSFSFSCHIIKL